MYKTENFFVGFEYPRSKNHGIVYFQGESFCNIWVQKGDWRKDGKEKWLINKDGKAFELDFQHDSISEDGFDSVQEILDYLENWWKENQ